MISCRGRRHRNLIPGGIGSAPKLCAPGSIKRGQRTIAGFAPHLKFGMAVIADTARAAVTAELIVDLPADDLRMLAPMFRNRRDNRIRPGAFRAYPRRIPSYARR